MPRQSRPTNDLRFVAYHFSEFDDHRGLRMMTRTKSTIPVEQEEEERDSIQPTFSTTELYRQRNVMVRPCIPRREAQILPASNVVEFDINLNDNVEQVVFIVSPRFRRLITRFQTKLFTYFPNIPCGFCGVLSLPRTTSWLSAERATAEAGNLELGTVLHMPLHQDGAGRVAICTQCKRKPRSTIAAGPWPEALLQIPQRSKMFLSPVKLNCNLGRSQSHSGTTYHNPYSTYRTLSGSPFVFLVSQ
jgi:hypothetical protein